MHASIHKKFNEMKRIFLCLVLLVIILSGCSHKIYRAGYDVKKGQYRNCDIAITRYMVVSDSVVKVGEIRLGDTGFSSECGEADAIEILQNEGCALGADIINIIEEKKPNFCSSCYRYRAEFYIYKNPMAKGKSDIFYNPEFVRQRDARDDQKKFFSSILGFGLGMVSGSIMYLLLH